jgi:hypothetical protein
MKLESKYQKSRLKLDTSQLKLLLRQNSVHTTTLKTKKI